MAKTLAICLFLMANILSSQVRQGYYNAAVNGKRVGPDRTTMDKAHVDGMILKATYPDSLVEVLPPASWRVEIPNELKAQIALPLFMYNSILSQEPTATSVTILIEVNRSDLSYVYIKFREIGGQWMETTKGTDKIQWIGSLKPGTVYEYMVYTEDLNGNKINSELLTFNTL